MKQGAGRREESFPDGREPVTAALLMKAMTSEGQSGGMNAAGANSPACKVKSHAAVHLQPRARFTCQGLPG